MSSKNMHSSMTLMTWCIVARVAVEINLPTSHTNDDTSTAPSRILLRLVFGGVNQSVCVYFFCNFNSVFSFPFFFIYVHQFSYQLIISLPFSISMHAQIGHQSKGQTPHHSLKNVAFINQINFRNQTYVHMVFSVCFLGVPSVPFFTCKN